MLPEEDARATLAGLQDLEPTRPMSRWSRSVNSAFVIRRRWNNGPGEDALLQAVFSGAAAEPGRSIRRRAVRRRCRGVTPDCALRTVLPGFGTPFMRDAPRHR